jgi:hypothetical protein
MLKYLAGVMAAALALWPWSTLAAPAWEQWQSVPSVFDLGGPRGDGSLVVAGSAALYTLTTDGSVQPFARGPGGYRDDAGTEAYMAVSPGQHVGGANCDFVRDDVFVLRMHTPIGVTRVDKTGEDSGSFTNVDAPGLNGIAFDTAGAFDHRLLLTGPAGTKTEVMAVDCKGATQVITRTAPQVEGGMDVAPESFGVFAGSLIAPDENTGLIWAIAPDGSARQVVNTGLQKGSDVGVESVAFVPSGFTSRGGFVYYADRKSPTAQYVGTDHVLRLSSSDLAAAGVQDGDLLAATEGGASTIAVRCDTSCRIIPVITSPTAAHGEGHLVFTLNAQPSPTPSPRLTPSATPVASRSNGGVAWLVAIMAAVLAGLTGAFIALAASRRRR